ncbi:S24 family peptidase [Chryseobacterium indologenes]|uniref:S24 family peptidase n=1 Tax=Chryseobacterium indologenes TaxID=253 RepID=UPI0016283E57|nr:S24 family peptidase [Chryseobacterium indologenes]
MQSFELKVKIEGFYNFIALKGLRNIDIVTKTGAKKGNISSYMNKKLEPSENFIELFETSYDVNLNDYEDKKLSKSTAKDVISELNRIKKNKHKTSEGRLIDESELVPVEQYIIPIKGQAGLKKAFFYPDEYVEKNFEKELAYVRPKDRAVYHKIEVDGGSMPGVLNPGEWARCVEIPKNLWLEKGTFKPDKIYCLWHKDLGILFKRISKVRLDVITLSSDNTDKNDYPDQDFQLIEFSKILIVKMKEVIL